MEATASSPGAGFFTAGPAGWWVLAWYAVLGATAALAAYGGPWRGFAKRAALVLVATAFLPTLFRTAKNTVAGPPSLRCSFIAVGHGAATLLETPSGANILCDAGALGAPQRVTDTIARALWSRGITRLDAVVISHADVDHYNALPGLLERFRVDEVWTSNLTLPSVLDGTDRSAPAELLRVLRNSGTPIKTLKTGDRVRVGSANDPSAVHLEVMHPSDLGVVGSDNANSLVLGVKHRGRRLLLTGDLESPCLELLLKQEPYDCDLMVAPHHGSQRSNPPGLAAWGQPEFVVISSGGPHPGAGDAYRDAGAEVANTHTTGMLTAVLGPGPLELRAYRGLPR